MRGVFADECSLKLLREGRLSELLARCTQLLEELRLAHSNIHPDVGFALEDVGYVNYEIGDFARASKCLEESLAIMRIALGENNEYCTRNLSNLGRMYMMAGRFADAEPLLARALEITKGLPPEEQIGYPAVLINLARLHSERGEYALAQALLIDAMKRRLRDYNWAHPKFGVVFDHLSRLYWKAGKRLAAIRAISKALRIYRTAGSTEIADYAMMLAFFGRLQAEQGRLDEATHSYEMALDILRHVRPEGHYQLLEVERHFMKAKATQPMQSSERQSN